MNAITVQEQYVVSITGPVHVDTLRCVLGNNNKVECTKRTTSWWTVRPKAPGVVLHGALYIVDAVSDDHAKFVISTGTDNGQLYVNRRRIEDQPLIVKVAPGVYASETPEVFTEWAMAGNELFTHKFEEPAERGMIYYIPIGQRDD